MFDFSIFSNEVLEKELERRKNLKEIGFNDLMDCVTYVDVLGHVLMLHGKNHYFKGTEEIVPYVETNLNIKVIK